MSGGDLYLLALNGPATSFRGQLLVADNPETMPGDGIGLACRLLDADGAVVGDVLLIARLLHWSAKVLSCARPGDLIQAIGEAEPVEVGAALTTRQLVVRDPAQLAIWNCVAAGPDPTSKTPIGGAAA